MCAKFRLFEPPYVEIRCEVWSETRRKKGERVKNTERYTGLQKCVYHPLGETIETISTLILKFLSSYRRYHAFKVRYWLA